MEALIVKFETLDHALTILQRDHALLATVFERSPQCLGRRIGDHCDSRPCVNGDPCSFNLRHGLFQLTNVTVARFRHEDEAMRQFNSPTYGDIHRKQHTEMTTAIQSAVSLYYRCYNHLGAIDEMNRFAEMYWQHFATTDADMLMAH